MPPPTNSATLAARLVVAGGSGTAADVAAVVPEIAKLDIASLQFLVDKRASVVACRGSVTDVATRLRGVTPRGWEGTGRTWDSVPGTYLSSGRRVIVATIAAGGGRAVPERGPDTHGSCNLAIHETMHGHDYLNRHRALRAKRFEQARQADLARLGTYERQSGRAGLEETYAESAARFFHADPSFPADWPALAAYWRGDAIPSPGLVADSAEPAPAGKEAKDGPIGSAEILDDGTIVLDLRAQGPRGAIGHANIAYRPGDPDYERIQAHVFPQRARGLTADAPAVREPVLVRPFGQTP